jgi:hypothetical protein
MPTHDQAVDPCSAAAVVPSKIVRRWRTGRDQSPKRCAWHCRKDPCSASLAFGVLTNLRADIVQTQQLDIPSREPSVVADVLAQLVGSLASHTDGITAIGIGLGGAIRHYTHISRAPFLSWRDIDFAALMHGRVGLPAVISNDLDALMRPNTGSVPVETFATSPL